jgi:hypothetical protein
VPEVHAPAHLRHHVLADPTGRRRRHLAIAARVATTALGLWLVVLILGGLGLQPLAGLPIVGGLGTRAAAPPALPGRVQAAVARHTTVTPAAPPLRSAATAPFSGKARTTPATRPVKTSPGHGRTSAAPVPYRPTTTPSLTAPGKTRTPPGQTRTEAGPPTSTPGTTPDSNRNAHAKGTVTTP